MYEEPALWKQMSKALQKYTKLKTRKTLHSIYFESQSALEHSLAKIHKTVGFSGACRPFKKSRFFKGQVILHLQDLHTDHTNDILNHLRMECIQALHSLRSFQHKTKLPGKKQKMLWHAISSSKKKKKIIGVAYQGFEEN